MRVRLIDAEEPGSGCSSGNAGLIQCASIVPIAMPGVVRSVPAMLLDPDQPLTIRWRYMASLMPYLLAFLREAQPARAAANARALATIIPRAYEAYQPLLAAAGLSNMVRRTGELYVYETARAFAAAQRGFDVRREHGIEAERVPAGQLRELEPALSSHLAHGMYVPDSYQTIDPQVMIAGLAKHFVANGGQFLRRSVIDAEHDNGGPIKLSTDDGPIDADRVVIALGAFSGALARKFGSRVTLNSERGYHLTLPAPGFALRGVVLSGEYRFAASPIGDGIRLAGTAELARIGAPPDFRRAERLLPLARKIVPGLQSDGATRWMGHRPSTPDSLPVIDRSPCHSNVFMAYGHGHTGLTLAAITGQIVSDLVLGRHSAYDLKPFSSLR